MPGGRGPRGSGATHTICYRKPFSHDPLVWDFFDHCLQDRDPLFSEVPPAIIPRVVLGVMCLEQLGLSIGGLIAQPHHIRLGHHVPRVPTDPATAVGFTHQLLVSLTEASQGLRKQGRAKFMQPDHLSSLSRWQRASVAGSSPTTSTTWIWVARWMISMC